MKFQLCHNDKVIAEIKNDLVRFDDNGGNVDQIGFDVDTAHEVNCVKCDIGLAKIIQPFAVKGELWFPPYSLSFTKEQESESTYVIIQDELPAYLWHLRAPYLEKDKDIGRLFFTGEYFSKDRSEVRKYIYGSDSHWNINEINKMLNPTKLYVVDSEMIDSLPGYICSCIRCKNDRKEKHEAVDPNLPS